ncbi:hypothetical protein ACFSQ3_13050 [Sphingobacterium corticis]|uniref:Uncharacterized protein n=1 Tax=Sphingobacterium corticis TaxID=1812823 RepID=A0ABW5NMK6_9SPHI
MKQKITFKGKEIVIDLTPEQIASANRQSIHFTDIKTLDDALSFIGETPESFKKRTQFDDDAQKAYKELELICLAIRQGNELGDRWYYPWFNSTRTSRGFSYDDYGYDSTHSYVGSRLCVENAEKAKYIGEQFVEIYSRYINGDSLAVEVSQVSAHTTKKTFENYTDMKTFEDACSAVGVDHEEFHNQYKSLPDDAYAYMQLRIISQALNGGSNMDYTDTDIYKYYPWFNSVGSSRGFSYRGYHYDASHSGVGSRLTYKSEEIAEYAGKQFIEIYNKYIN